MVISEAATKASLSAMSGEWVEKTNAAGGKYWYNTDTHASSPTNPNVASAAPSANIGFATTNPMNNNL